MASGGHPKMIIVEPNDRGCWVCVSHPRVQGYPVMGRGGRRKRISRHVYETIIGPLSSGQVVRHECDDRACLNPWHLLAGSNKQNSEDMVRRGRQTRGERHHAAKLTADQVWRIYRREDGLSITKTAAHYQISTMVVKAIRAGKAWRWLTQESSRQSS